MSEPTKPRVLVLVGSTRPERQGPTVAQWVIEQLATQRDFDTELVDLADVGLPLLDEPNPARKRQYVHEHTKRWSSIVDPADGFVLVTPEHNRSMPASVKNALDCLYWEWQHKPLGFVSYSTGIFGGVRAVESVRQVAVTLSLIPLNAMVNLPRIHTLVVDGELNPPPDAVDALAGLTTDLIAHLGASAVLRRR